MSDCPTCGQPLPSITYPREAIYRPTRERVTVLRISNRGQYRPGDPGSGERLYTVQFRNGSTGTASLGELMGTVGHPFRYEPLISTDAGESRPGL